MEHEHITFYSNSARGRAALLGGEELIIGGNGEHEAPMRQRTANDKHIEIVQYLKQLPCSSRATFVDIKKVLQIDLKMDDLVYDMMKGNPKLDFEQMGDVMTFQYRDKYKINNIKEVKETVERVKSGVVMKDILDCYPGIEGECLNLIIGGDVIACKNKALKSFVLFPRGVPFFTKLSGTVTASPGCSLVKTSEDLTKEIRRGDAVCVGGSLLSSAPTEGQGTQGSWFRVATAVGASATQQQSEKSSAPLSVTSEATTSSNNAGVSATTAKKVVAYHDEFNSDTLPLDGDFDGENIFVGTALRHGCTNDIRQCWADTLPDFKSVIKNDEKTLETELKKSKLVDRVGPTLARQKLIKQEKVIQRKKRKATDTGFSTHNSHLAGTELGRMLEKIE